MTREDKMHPPIDELALYSGGDCGLFDKWRIARHLASCSACTAEMKSFRSIGQNLRAATSDMPAGLNWDRLAEEMSANIHLGLEAGECVAPPKTNPVHLDWRAAIVMAGMSIALVGAWFLNPIPRRSTGEIALRAPKVELRTTSAGLELNENGNSLVLLHGPGKTQQPAMILSAPGSLRARYVDTDTGQITINNVFSE